MQCSEGRINFKKLDIKLNIVLDTDFDYNLVMANQYHTLYTSLVLIYWPENLPPHL